MPRRSGMPLPLLMLLVIAVPAALGIWFFVSGGGADDGDIPLSDPITRGPLRVSVIESGSLESLSSHTIRSRVEGRNEIIYLIEEGTVLTEEDVQQKTVLVKLDDSNLRERIDRQNIDVSTARNVHDTALANQAIQKQQNASDIRKAALEVRFAVLDLERYVGSALSTELLDAHRALMEKAGNGATGSVATESDGPSPLARLIAGLFQSGQLKGEAMQKRRQLQSDIQLAIEERGRAQVKVEWSRKLEAKGYLSKEELEADRLAFERRKIELERAETALEQYERYDFPKETERLLSDLVDARDRQKRTIAKADSAAAKFKSDVNTRGRQLKLQEAKLTKLKAQLEACVMRADRKGLVVYASSGKDRGWRDNDIIAEGTSVRQRQEIIRIPQPGSLGAKVNVHESVIDKIEKGLACRITLDAIPDLELRGVVLSRAPLPNSVNRWMNPGLKVYATVIDLTDEPPELRPNMSCSAEIVLGELPNVLSVPTQAVGGSVENPVVWVWRAGEMVRQPVELGASNDRYVEVKGGLEEGERVHMDPPREELDDVKAGAEGEYGNEAGAASDTPTKQRKPGRKRKPRPAGR